MSFSLHTCDVMMGRDSFLRICLCPGTRGVRMPPLFFTTLTLPLFLTSLPCIHPCFFFLFLFFFLLVGAFCFYLLILFVAKQAEGGAPLCDLLLALHLPPLLCPPPPREREREREECRPNSCCDCRRRRHCCCPGNVHMPQIKPEPRPWGLWQGHSLCGLAWKCWGRWKPACCAEV